jgi:hypothetical protein
MSTFVDGILALLRHLRNTRRERIDRRAVFRRNVDFAQSFPCVLLFALPLMRLQRVDPPGRRVAI